jgi:hypothetical protein
MRSDPLFVLCGFADDPQCILAAIGRPALVRVELLLNLGLRLSLRSLPRLMNGELCAAKLANSEDGNILNFLDNSQISFRHGGSLAHVAGRV